MRTAAEVPSLIDDADFLAELDRMESGPAAPEAGHAPALAANSTQPDAAPVQRPVPEPAPSVREPLPVGRAAAPKPAAPEKVDRSQPPRRLRLESPAKPAPPPRREAPIRPDREAPMRPAHVAEIGEHARAPRPAAHLAAPSATLAALTVVLGLTVGAGSAALLFHERVAQIVVTWSK